MAAGRMVFGLCMCGMLYFTCHVESHDELTAVVDYSSAMVSTLFFFPAPGFFMFWLVFIYMMS